MCGMANTGLYGYAEMGGSASWTIDVRDAPAPEGGSESWGGGMIVTHLPRRGEASLGGGGGVPAGLAPTGGGTRRARWTPNAQGFLALGSLTPAEEKRRERSVPDSSSKVVARDTTMVPTSPLEMGGGQVVPLGCSVGVSQRGMRPAGEVGPSRQEAPVGVLDVRGNSAVRPLSAEAVEFSPTLGPRTGVTAGLVNMSSRAGIVAPAVVADFPVPAGAGVRFSAVAEVHASASEVNEDTFVAQASEQRSERHIDPRNVPRVVNVPMAGTSVSEPLEHSALKIDLDGRPMEGVLVLEPLEHSVLDVSLDGGPMEGESDLEPLEHSVLDVNLDSRLQQDELDSGPLEHSVPDHTLCGGAVLFGKVTVSDPLEHSGLITSDDVVLKSVPEGPQSRGD